MRKTLLLAALLVAQPLAAQRVMQIPLPTVPPRGGVTLTLPPDPGLVTEIPLKEGSPQCAETWGRTVTIPTPEAVRCYRVKAMEYIVGEVKAGRVRPGPKATRIVYPGVTWAVLPVWVYGSVAGTPKWVCAAGVATNPIQVFLGQKDRTLSLVAWETANHALAGSLDRYDLGDSAVVAAATNHAAAACPAY